MAILCAANDHQVDMLRRNGSTWNVDGCAPCFTRKGSQGNRDRSRARHLHKSNLSALITFTYQ